MNKKDIEKIAHNYKTPFYLFDEVKFVKNIKAIDSAFRSRYSNFQLAYSFKTNYANCICKAAKRCGLYAEVVSPMEVTHALKLDFNDAIYNGVCKSESSIKCAFEHGFIVNADSLNDFKKIISIAKKHSNPKIGIRMNIDIGNGLKSRFGVKHRSDDYNEIIKLAAKSGIKIAGIHCHVSEARDLDSWSKRCNEMFKIADDFDSLEYIDLGSNLFSGMHQSLKEQYDCYVPEYDDYAEVVAFKFKEKFKDESVKLILETGTPIVSDTVEVVSSVFDIKQIEDENIAILDVSKFDIGTVCAYKDVPTEVITQKRNNLDEKKYKLTGYTCIEDDVIKKEYKGILDIGDIVVFKNTGSYSLTFSKNFIKPSMKMLRVLNHKNFMIVSKARSKAEYKDIFGRFV